MARAATAPVRARGTPASGFPTGSHLLPDVTPSSRWNSCQPQSENETAPPRIPLAVLTMIVYAFLSQIAIGEGRTGWSGDSADGDSMMDVGIAGRSWAGARHESDGNPSRTAAYKTPNTTS